MVLSVKTKINNDFLAYLFSPTKASLTTGLLFAIHNDPSIYHTAVTMVI